MTRVDPAKERIDEAFHHFAAEMSPDGLTHRRIGSGTRSTRQDVAESGPGNPTRADDSGSAHLPEIARHTQDQTLRQRSQMATRVDVSRAGGGSHEIVSEPERLGQLDGSGNPGEERVGSGIDADAGHARAGDLPADGRRRFDHLDAQFGSGPRKEVRSGETGHASADDEHIEVVVARSRVRTVVGGDGTHRCTAARMDLICSRWTPSARSRRRG